MSRALQKNMTLSVVGLGVIVGGLAPAIDAPLVVIIGFGLGLMVGGHRCRLQ